LFDATPGETMLGMKHALTVTSLISIFLVLLHVSDDIVRGFEPGGLKHLQTYATMGLWLYGTVALSGRRSGYVIMLIGNLLGVLVSIAHLLGPGLVGGRVANSDGKLLWVLTPVLLGVIAPVAAALAAQGLWILRRRKANNAADAPSL
jgi:hypothetical protein